MGSIAVVFGWNDQRQSAEALERIAAMPLVGQIAVAALPEVKVESAKCRRLHCVSLRSADAVNEVLRWFESTDASHLLWTLSSRVELTETGLARLAHAAADTRSAILYSDYFDQQPGGGATLHPLIDYQPGSIRDDFDFGHLLLLSRDAIVGLADKMKSEHVAGDNGGWYDLRLCASERGPVVHLSEPTYLVTAATGQADGEAHFSYVDPRNRELSDRDGTHRDRASQTHRGLA